METQKTESETHPRVMMASHEKSETFAAQSRAIWFRENRRGVVFALLPLTLFLSFMGYMLISTLRTQAVLSTPAKQGQAYIVRKDFTPVKSGPIRYEVTFRMDGRLITGYPQSVVQWDKTQIGATVPVTYHIGENGDMLISDWQMTPAKDN